MNLVSISGSRSRRSRSAWLSQRVQTRLETRASRSRLVNVRELPPAALIGADVQADAICRAIDEIAGAAAVLAASACVPKAGQR